MKLVILETQRFELVDQVLDLQPKIVVDRVGLFCTSRQVRRRGLESSGAVFLARIGCSSLLELLTDLIKRDAERLELLRR